MEWTNFSKEWKTRITRLTPPSKYRLKMSWPRDVNRLSQELKCQKHVAKATYIYPKKMACVFFVTLTSEYNETLDAEKHGSSVSPTASGRTSHAAVLIPYV